MTQVITWIFAIMDLLVLVGCAIRILHAIPEEKETPRWVRILAWVGYAAIGILLPSFFKNDIITTVVMTCYYVAVGRLLYYKNKIGIVYQIIYWLGFLVTQYLAACIMYFCVAGLRLDDPLPSCLMVIMRITFLLILTFVLRRLIQKRYAKGTSYLKIRGMIIVPIFSAALIFLYVCSSDMFLLRYGYGWLLVYCLLVLVINLYCVYFWYDVAKNGELKHQLQMIQQQNELTLQYYKDLEDNYGRSRKIIHDIRNHLIAIEQSAKLENHAYIEDMHEMLNSLGMKFYSENRMLNIVLNDKLKAFAPDQVTCRLGGVNLDFISDMDMTTIFANILDNAVEAQPNKETRRIVIKGEQIHDFIVVKIANPWEGEYKEGVSLKKGHEGYGLQNVRTAVGKYHGELQIDVRDKVFAATLAFSNVEIMEREEKEDDAD